MKIWSDTSITSKMSNTRSPPSNTLHDSETDTDSQSPQSLANAVLRFGVLNPKNENKPYQAIVDLGKRLNKLGGYDAMVDVANLVRENDRTTARELEFAWDGIGMWRA